MDRPARRVRRPWYRLPTAIGLAVVGCLTPVAAVGTWVLIVHPAKAADAVATGDIWPLARAIVRTLGEAVVALIAYL